LAITHVYRFNIIIKPWVAALKKIHVCVILYFGYIFCPWATSAKISVKNLQNSPEVGAYGNSELYCDEMLRN